MGPNCRNVVILAHIAWLLGVLQRGEHLQFSSVTRYGV